MRHNILMDGHLFRLRPVDLDDAGFILGLRTDPQCRAFVHPAPGGRAFQEAWIAEYFHRAGDYYFILESKGAGTREGTVGVYNIDAREGCGEWGRWIVRPGSIGAIESAWLIYRVAFECLELRMVYARIAAGNKRAIAFQGSCGLGPPQLLPACLHLESGVSAALEYRMSRELWDSRKLVFERQIEKIMGMRARAC
ncbi:MAG TPA: GNAT family N-acetyltransferase [Bryobacteraceae bacterium]|nr:GNAT family N-acetyltransferase [Bryobacteraceae bacterium]